MTPHASLRCPTTKQRLRLITAVETAGLRPRQNCTPPPIGATSRGLLNEDGRVAYPIVDDIPILLAPEALRIGDWTSDLNDARYAEAYSEMAFYNQVSQELMGAVENSDGFRFVKRIVDLPAKDRWEVDRHFDAWVDAGYDAAAQRECYLHMGDIRGKRFLQIGGKGTHAVKMLVAGAAEAWLVTPMAGEIRYGRALAEAFGVADQFFGVASVCEELPLANESIDGVLASGCIHHTVTGLAMPEIARALVPGGRFAAAEPWRTPLYSLGTKIFGKRETSVFCRPITAERSSPMAEVFSSSRLAHHGAITRHPFLALNKLGLPLPLRWVYRIGSVDDTVAGVVPGLRRSFGSSVAMLGVK